MDADQADKAKEWISRTTNTQTKELPPADLEGYYLWFLANSNSKQMKLFKYALGRLAKENPRADPRVVLVEFFALSVYNYEKHVQRMKKGKFKCHKEALEGLM